MDLVCFLIGKEALIFGFEVKQILYFRKDIIITKFQRFLSDYSFWIKLLASDFLGFFIYSCDYLENIFSKNNNNYYLFLSFIYILFFMMTEWNIVKRILRNKIPPLSAFDSLFFSSLVLSLVATYSFWDSWIMDTLVDDAVSYILSSGCVFILIYFWFETIKTIWRDI